MVQVPHARILVIFLEWDCNEGIMHERRYYFQEQHACSIALPAKLLATLTDLPLL